MYNEILDKIIQYETIIIHGHTRPDGDCYGSQIGLKSIISTNFPNKKVFVVGQTCEYVSFLGQMDNIPDETFHGALSIICDTATTERISDERYKLSDFVIKIDHHLPVDDYGNLRLVETKLPACSLIITEFMKIFNLDISLDGANALYTGILTDTGKFRFRGVNSRVFHLAGILLDKGVNVEYIDGKLSMDSIQTLKLKGYVYLNFKTTTNGFAYFVMNRGVISQFQVSDEEAASMVTLLGSLEECPVWGLFIEYPDNEIRIRLRSRGPRVDKLAGIYEGGGHLKASGATLNKWDDLEQFLSDVDALVKRYKEEGILE